MRKIKLSEESYNKLKNKLINEISYRTVDKAYYRSETLFSDVKKAFEDFYSALSDAFFQDGNDGRRQQNPYLVKIKELSEQIYDILKHKSIQQDNFYDTINGIDNEKFYNSDDGENNEIDDMELNYLRNKFSK